MTFAENLRMLQASRREALTDGLTGLRNRRALMADLERALREGTAARWCSALFDLDGFKQYNDTFGHPAGDALLARLGARAAAQRRRRRPRLPARRRRVLRHRLGAATATSRRRSPDAGAALTERGEAFAVGCSFGSVLLPHEADSAERRCGSPTSGCTSTSRAGGRRR